MRARTIAASLVLATAPAWAVSCGDQDGTEPESSRDAFERELESLAGVSDARVDREAFDTDYWGEVIVVDMEVGTSAGEVTSVLDAFKERQKGQDGAPQDAHVTVGAGTTETSVDEYGVDAPPMAFPALKKAGNARVARLFVAGIAAFPGAAVHTTFSGWSVGTRVEGDDPRPEVDRMIATVRNDDLLARSRTVDLFAVAGDGAGERRIQVSAFDTVEDPALLGAWKSVRSHLDISELRSLWLSPEWIEAHLRNGEGVTPRTLTTARYGDALWPLIHGLLDGLTVLPPSSELTVVNEWKYEGSGEESGYREDRFLRILPGRQPAEDAKGRTWNADAADYLAAQR